MATKKSSKKKSAKKTAKSAKKSVKRTRSRAETPLMTAEERRKLVKAHDGYDDLIEEVVRKWSNDTALKVPGLSPAKLTKLLRDAERAKKKEAELRAALERKLGASYDARLRAEHDAWRAVLDVNAAVKLFARRDGALAERFAFLSDALTAKSAPEQPKEE
ncbi:hypothetical protein [Sandaracinus amylolyticus]|uniref:Uncharacterized protein n=1 Tax=Sandaracinus amylolyticus TaxID=927083 RepID=A0A0F6SDD8_9BACT|nr:hypothetical protein [Sandaracinus amylolyticus]AKF03269.1 hypothetical protein DB32_000418 [Sandaracinus amylolyticus]